MAVPALVGERHRAERVRELACGLRHRLEQIEVPRTTGRDQGLVGRLCDEAIGVVRQRLVELADVVRVIPLIEIEALLHRPRGEVGAGGVNALAIGLGEARLRLDRVPRRRQRGQCRRGQEARGREGGERGAGAGEEFASGTHGFHLRGVRAAVMRIGCTHFTAAVQRGGGSRTSDFRGLADERRCETGLRPEYVQYSVVRPSVPA